MIETLTHNPNSKIIHSWSNVEPYCPGYSIECGSVFSITEGVVVAIGQATTSFTITVQINDTEYIRYKNLSTIEVSLNDSISISTYLGDANKFVQLEYCTSWMGASKFCCRIQGAEAYKQNPADILFGRYIPQVTRAVTTATQHRVYNFNQAQLAEFSNNRGDHIVEF